MSKGKVLIILSDAHHFEVKKSDGTVVEEETGVFVMELAKPLDKILDAGYDVTFASPSGKPPGKDPTGQAMAFMGTLWGEKKFEDDLIDKMKVEKNFSQPRPFKSIKDDELAEYRGIFIPGGHAPLTDLGDDSQLGRILWYFHNNSKPTEEAVVLMITAVICHGPYALLSTKAAPNSKGFAYEGYKITSWSDAEEKLVETMKWGEIEKVESTLRENGAEMVTGTKEKLGSITLDRELVSGANPAAANALGDKFVEMLGEVQWGAPQSR